ncbi:MAG TPA: ABC transporter permease [Bryobacteraceae bacterium]|nr:ABC transporter permease [Bryobacteraceae bacterium]
MRLPRLFGRRNEQDLEDEIESHLRLAETDKLAAGESARQARQAALRELGNAGLIKDATRQVWGWSRLEAVAADVQFGARAFAKRPGISALLVATLALGIGATTAVFSLLNTVLLSGPPYPNGSGLISLFQSQPEAGEFDLGASTAEYLDYKTRNRSCVSLAGYEEWDYDLTGNGQAERITGVRATADLFSTLGSRPVVGRGFNRTDDTYGAPPVAVLSFGFWQSRYGGSREALGKTLRLNEKEYTIVGVMPRRFSFPAAQTNLEMPPALWIPMQFSPDEVRDRASSYDVNVVGLLKPGVSAQVAEEDMQRVAHEFEREHPDVYSGNLKTRAHIERLGGRKAEQQRPALMLLAATVFLVLLIAIANAANLLLIQGNARQREMAVRSALGAGRLRLTQQFLSEGILLSSLAAAFGYGIASLILQLVAKYGPHAVFSERPVLLNGPMLGFGIFVAAATGIFCGLVPVIQAKGRDLNEALKEGGRANSAGGRSGTTRGLLVIIETALATMLLIGAALLIRSFTSLLQVNPGFDPQNVAIVRTSFNRSRYANEEHRRRAEHEIIERILHAPFTESAALTSHIPLADERAIGFVIEGRDPNQFHWAQNALVDGAYFETMRIRLLEGRRFDARDMPNAPTAAVVNRTLADQYWPGDDVLGKRVHWGGRRLTIVGVVDDVRVKALDARPEPMIYNSVFQVESGATSSAVFVIRYRGSMQEVTLATRRIIQSVDNGLPVFSTRSMGDVLLHSLAERSFTVYLLSGFALFAFGLALVGLYSVLSYAVQQRRRELGLRLALGAEPWRLVKLVVRDGLSLTLAGLGVGIVAGGLLARGMARFLFGVKPLDAQSFAAAGLLLLLAALLASFVPALRAARVNPIVALRSE